MNYALQINNLCKTYKNTDFSLQNVSLAIPQGSIMGFVGKNGAGKSTTINTLLNIAFKDSGTVKFYGDDLDDQNIDTRNEIGVVFDTTHFSVENTPARIEKVMHDIYTNWDRKEFYRLLERFSLPHNKKITTFSRGMVMKLSAAVALSHHAKFLILDEATAGLDPVAREELLDILLEFVGDETIRNNFYSIGSSLPIMLVGQLALVIVILLITIYDGGQNVFLVKTLCGGAIGAQLGGFSALCGTAMQKDALSKWNKFELTLPVKRTTVIQARYISFLLYFLMGFLMALITCGLFYWFVPSMNSEPITYAFAFGTAFGLGIPTFMTPLIIIFASILFVLSYFLSMYLYRKKEQI